MTSPVATQSLARRLTAPAYIILTLSILFEIIDVSIALRPTHFDTVIWRFGALGTASNAVARPLLLLTFIYAVALFAGDRKVLRTVGALASFVGVLLLVGMAAFALDSLQVKGQIPPVEMHKFYIAAGVALMKMGLLAITAGVLAVNALRAPGAAQGTTRAPRGSAAGLVMSSTTRSSSTEKTAIPDSSPASTSAD